MFCPWNKVDPASKVILLKHELHHTTSYSIFKLQFKSYMSEKSILTVQLEGSLLSLFMLGWVIEVSRCFSEGRWRRKTWKRLQMSTDSTWQRLGVGGYHTASCPEHVLWTRGWAAGASRLGGSYALASNSEILPFSFSPARCGKRLLFYREKSPHFRRFSCQI